jgi:hypothetical protein
VLADTFSAKDSAITEFARSNFAAATPAASMRLMADKMGELESRAVFSAAQGTLRQMNFTVRAARNESGKRIAIEGSLRNTKVLMLIEDKGIRGIEVRTDWAGLSEEKSCTQMQKALEAGMREKGVDITDGTEPAERHLDPRGGQLIRAAGKAHCDNLAEALIQYENSHRNERRRDAEKARV